MIRPRESSGWWVVLAIVLVVGAILGVKGATKGGSSPTDTSPPADQSSADSKYTQTWPTAYADTTCDQWLNQMTSDQRFAAAADMLAGARDNGDGGTGVPTDDLVNQFEADVDSACVLPTSKLAEIGASVYLTERSKYRP